MTKSCLAFFATWSALFAGLWAVTHRFFYPPGDWIGALIVSFAASLGVNSLIKAVIGTRDARLLAPSGLPPRDGARVGVEGTLELLGEPLLAPLSGTPCIAYDYEIGHTVPTKRGSSEVVDLGGFGLAPSALCSENGTLRLLAFPSFEDSPRSVLDASAQERARSFVAATPFEAVSPVSALSEAAKLLGDSTGAIRKDWKVGSDADLEKSFFRERILEAGALVCILGRYSAEGPAIVPDPSTGGVRVLREPRAEAIATLRIERTLSLVAAALLILVPAAAIWGILTHRERWFEENGKPCLRTERAEASLAVEREAAARQERKRADADSRAEFSGTPLPPDGGAPWRAVVAYLDAIERGDEAAYAATVGKALRAQSPSFALLASARLTKAAFGSGFVVESSCHIKGRGVVAGADCLLEVSLELEAGEWKVVSSRVSPLP